MKALTIWQPWATLIDLGRKRMETRGWKTAYRGDLLITAAKTWNRELKEITQRPVFQDALLAQGSPYKAGSEAGVNALSVPVMLAHGEALTMRLPGGHALCVVRLIDCVRVETIRAALSQEELAFGNYSDGRYAWILEDLRRLEKPMPWMGTQGLRHVSARDESVIQLSLMPTCAEVGAMIHSLKSTPP